MDMSRRQFFRVCAASLGGSSVAAIGLTPGTALAEVRDFKLARATETRNTCPYCSVSCGVILYSLGDKAKNAKAEIIHVEGDPDHPINRGTLCPKGAALLDMIHSPNRLKYPEVREAGGNEWKRISWDDAFTRIAKHIKADRDQNFVETNAKGDTVNRFPSLGLVGSSAVNNEAGYLTSKVARALGLVGVETQARI
jgi:formate dehydrogenase major subunit